MEDPFKRVPHRDVIEARHPAFVSAALYRDHSRGRDDLTVLALRNLR
jgi:hypothetical protein